MPTSYAYYTHCALFCIFYMLCIIIYILHMLHIIYDDDHFAGAYKGAAARGAGEAAAWGGSRGCGTGRKADGAAARGRRRRGGAGRRPGLRLGEGDGKAAGGGGRGCCAERQRGILLSWSNMGWDACGQSPNSATIVERRPPGMSWPAQFAKCSQRHRNV
jgi:hypothetical protein